MSAYQDAIAPAIPRPIGASRTVDAAIVAYYEGASFQALGASTRHTRKVILEHFRREHGTKKLRTLQRAHIAAILGKKPPFAARNWLKVLRELMAFAVNAGLRADDPTQGVRLPKAKAGEIHTWTEAEIAQFEAWHSVDSVARLAFSLLLYTAQRRGDVVRMGRQHIRDGVLSIRQEKTGTLVEIPVHPTLATIIAETPITGQMTFLTSVTGTPFSSAGSATYSASGATKPICQSTVPRTGCARRRAGGLPTRVAPNMRLPPSAVTKASPKCVVTPVRPAG
jgi:integrase